MARPIECTPSLTDAEWENFEKKVKANETKKVSKKEFDLGQKLVKLFDGKLNAK